MADLPPPPWESMPGEPARWYARFERYRLAGPARSLLGTFNAQRADKGMPHRGCVPGAWAEAARRWRWRERADAWDEEERRQSRAAHAAKTREMHERHAQEARGLQAKAIERLRGLRPEELGPAHVLHFLAAAAKLERLAVGELDDVQQPESASRVRGAGLLSFTLEDAVAAVRELEEAERDAMQRNGSQTPPPGSSEVP